MRAALVGRLAALGFSVVAHEDAGAAPVLVATRGPDRPGAPWVGLFAHYDIEEAGPGWTTEPFVLSLHEGRVFGRGVADNLGPLALRLLALEDRGAMALPGLVWVIQGEEEIGSPWAHRLYPQLALPEVAVWLEETGYFEADGVQRLLLRRPAHSDETIDMDAALLVVGELAVRAGRRVKVLDRYLNKAFGEAGCPCLTHLARGRPYLAMGPNDTQSRIHAGNESLPLDTLALSRDQFLGFLGALSCV